MDMWNYMNFYFQKFKDQDTAYFFYDSNKTSRVRWSIKDWKILDDHQDTAIPAPPAGWAISNGGNRTGIGNYQGPVMQGFTYYNEELGTTYEKSWIAVYDETTHQERVIESNCPSLEQSTMDKDGNVFFSTTYYSPLYALYGTGPAPCVIKMKADGTLDESYAPNDLRSYTGGFYGVNYRDLGNGKAVANVLHHDRIEGANFAGGQLEDAVVTQVDEDNTLWELHVIDLASGTSKIVSEGFVDGHDLGSYATYSQVDGRTFIFVQIYPDVGPQTSAIYELDANAAKVTLVGRAPGDIWGMERLR